MVKSDTNIIKTGIAVFAATFILTTAPLTIAAGQPAQGQITPQNELTQTVDDNTVTISYIVNASGNNSLAQTSVNLSQVPDELHLTSNRTKSIGRLESNEEVVVSYEVRVPADTSRGNYSVQANLNQEMRHLDSANHTIWVNYGNQESDDSSDEADGDHSSTNSEEGAGGGPIMVTRDCGWTCLDERIEDWIESTFDIGSWF